MRFHQCRDPQFFAVFQVSRQRPFIHQGNDQQGGILGLFNMFSGGALSRFSVFALGIMPYISASIIMQMTFSWDSWRSCSI